MENKVSDATLERLMEEFNEQHPSGDSFELARFMFNHGWHAGMSATTSLF